MFKISVLKTESFKKGIALSTALNVLSKGLTFFTTLLIAFYFGTSLETDIYFFVISIVTSISMFITGCTTSVVIPEVMHLGESGHKEDAMKITNGILFAYVIITVMAVFLFSFMPVQVFSRISKYSSSTILEHRFYFSFSSILLILITINTYLKEVLSVYRFFTFPMIISLVNSVFILGSIPLLKNCIGMKSVLTGLILGNFVNTIMLVWTLHKYAKWRFTLYTVKISGSLFKRMLYSQAGYGATAASALVPPYLLSGMSAGIIAALNFGKQISDIPGNFLTAQFSAVSGIKFNELMARSQFHELDMAFRKSLTFLISILFPICGITFVFNTEIVEFLFGRGAFSSASITDAAIFCKLFILSSPLIAVDYLSTRILIAAKKIRQSFWYQIGSNLFSIMVMFLLFPRFGGKAIPITVLILYSLNIIALLIMLHFFCPYIKYLKALAESLKILLVNAIIIFGIIILNCQLNQYGCNTIGRLTIGSILYLLFIYFSNLFFTINIDLQNIIKNSNLRIRSVFQKQ